MTKYGVGIGEDFPLDEEEARPAAEDISDCDEDWQRRRQKAREAWRRLRSQLRAEWRAGRRAFRDSLSRQDPVEPVDVLHDRRIHHLVIGGLALIGLAALLGRHRK